MNHRKYACENMFGDKWQAYIYIWYEIFV